MGSFSAMHWVILGLVVLFWAAVAGGVFYAGFRLLKGPRRQDGR